jgi:23S rRNA pseudouridine955/2504/2580 synthase
MNPELAKIEPLSAAGARPPGVERIEVDASGEGQRLDNWLLRRLKGVPKSHIYQLVRSGQVRINQSRCAPDDRLALGDIVRVPPVRVAQSVPGPAVPAVEFPVVFEDEVLLVIDKPAGVAVHGGSGVSSGVIEQLRAARPQAKMLELVHRLDRETSGLLMVAKSRAALTELQRQLRERETGKIYQALVIGKAPKRTRNFTGALRKRVLTSGEKFVDVHPLGQEAHTRVLGVGTIAAGQDTWLSLVQCELLTGRTHQIRVHLAHDGTPILGDARYGDFAKNKLLFKQGWRRMFLHAWRLQVRHPVTRQLLHLRADPPQEFNRSLFLPSTPHAKHARSVDPPAF